MDPATTFTRSQLAVSIYVRDTTLELLRIAPSRKKKNCTQKIIKKIYILLVPPKSPEEQASEKAHPQPRPHPTTLPLLSLQATERNKEIKKYHTRRTKGNKRIDGVASTHFRPFVVCAIVPPTPLKGTQPCLIKFHPSVI